MENELNLGTRLKVGKKKKKWQKQKTKKLKSALASVSRTHSPQVVKELLITGEFAVWVRRGGRSMMQKRNSPIIGDSVIEWVAGVVTLMSRIKRGNTSAVADLDMKIVPRVYFGL